VIVALPRG